MNHWLYRMEAKYGKYAIRNLPLYIVVLYVIGFSLNYFTNGTIYMEYLSLNPYFVLTGQPWRILTFLCAVRSSGIISLIFTVLFYYSIGQNLSNIWGAFKFNLFILFGVILTIILAFLSFFVTKNPYIFIDCYYVYLSMFLAFATIFPDAQVYFYGIIPMKVKWFAYIYCIFIALEFFNGDLGMRVSIVASLINFAIFLFSARSLRRYSPKEVRRKKVYHQKVKSNIKKATHHQCAICKRTEEDDPNLEFRYCSKCDGDYEYCNEHLFTHTHIKQ